MRDLHTRLENGTVGELKQTTHPQPDSPAPAPKIDDGGSAYPRVIGAVGIAPNSQVVPVLDGGMTLRDYFAAAALQALVQKAPLMDAEGEHGPKFDKATLTQFRHDMAVSAYDYADAMLAARKGGVA